MTNGYPSAARAPSMSVKRRSSNNRGRYVHVTVGILPSRYLMSHDIVDSFHPMSHGIVDQLISGTRW